jgi:protein involved in polysaccharide export with SLBB domain
MTKYRIALFIALLFSTAFFSPVAHAQNYASVKVDEMSDAQILQLMKQGEAAGFTNEAQLEQMALAKGMKADEVQKLKARVGKLKSQGTLATADKPVVTGREASETTQGGAIANEKKAATPGVGLFGVDLFRSGSITFEPNLRIATPKNYIIGPDDKLIIDLTGDNEVNYNLGVSTEGVIAIPFVGRVTVGGLNIEQASAKIKTAMAKIYASLSRGRTSLAINLGNIRSIKVIITGQVVKPGTYTISSLSTVYNALYASGGPAENGTFRNIQIIRNDKVVATVDVYDFLLKGIQKNNIRLQDQDVINIPVYQKRVALSGELKQPALFELAKNETLQDAINFAGGFTPQAYQAKIKSFVNTSKERKIIDIDQEAYRVHMPQNGDKYVVEAILDRFQNRVEIIGAVFRPGQFELEKGLTLKTLIQKAEGLTEDAFLNRGYINRLNADNTPVLIAFDVAKLMSGTQTDIALQREDKITISSIFDLREEYTVTVQGEVRAPSTVAYAEKMALADVIQMAGGFKEGATPNRIEISRRLRKTENDETANKTAEVFVVGIDQDLKIVGESFALQPFDIITVHSAENYTVQKQVKIEGEVKYPGMYTISNKNERISDLIQRAGGLTNYAYVEGSSLKRPGAAKVNPADKNAISDNDEDKSKLLNLKSNKDAGLKDAEATTQLQELLQSDLVGIDLDKILKMPQSKYDLLLEEGDVVRVPQILQTVKVGGEVLNPNSIVFEGGRSFKAYVNGAGGFTDNSSKSRAYIKYANGSAKSTSKFLFFNSYPKVKPGSEIFIPRKPEREKMNAQTWIGIGTAVASMAAIVVSLIRQ